MIKVIIICLKQDLCDELDLLTDIEADSYKIKINPETGKREIQCFTTALESFIEVRTIVSCLIIIYFNIVLLLLELNKIR